jgi:DNA-binding CsgD family transcriptional regulator
VVVGGERERDAWGGAGRHHRSQPPVTPRRLIVVEGPAAAIERDVDAARAAGFEIAAGFRGGPPARPTVIRSGVVATPSDAAEALLAALDGAGLIVAASADRETIDRLLEDLRHLGQVDHRMAAPDAAIATPELVPEARAILGLLAEGLSLGEAAETLGLARRTADRRLAEARRVLGVERTTEAIVRARRLGWLRRASSDG